MRRTPDPGARGNRRSSAPIIVVTVLCSLLWPLMLVTSFGSIDVLLNVGPDGPTRPLIQREIPDIHLTEGLGHDGQAFYGIARHPFDPAANDGNVTPLTYRYRRILYPAIAGLLVPGGGRGLIVVFLLESVVGVALGAWALTRLPGAPRWLPLTMAFTPGIVAAMGASLSDAFGAGLALVAVALSLERRWAAMIATLVLAALTRETLVIVAVGLACTPGMARGVRAATVAIPVGILGAWVLWMSHAAGTSADSGAPEQLAAPFAGWLSSWVSPAERLLLAGTFLLLVAGAVRCWRRAPQIAVMLGLGAALLTTISELVAWNWGNSMRPVAPLVPLAIWALLAERWSTADAELDDLTASLGVASADGDGADHGAERDGAVGVRELLA